jgi:GDPmannose 4,6-dehydratase
LGIESRVNLFEYGIGSNPLELLKLLRENFEEIYHFAGDSFTADSFRHPIRTMTTNIVGATELLETVRDIDSNTKVFIASSSEMFGAQVSTATLISESSPRKPINPYGISHAAMLDLSRFFRDTYKVQVSTGILFNHESEFRGPQFLTRKIASGLARLKLLGGEPLELGNLDAERDWGSAHEYVSIFQEILKHSSDDFIVASGKSVSARDLFVTCCEAAGFAPEFQGIGALESCIDSNSGKLLMIVSQKYYRPVDTPCLVGDTSKLEKLIGCKPSEPIENVLREMYAFEEMRLQKNV